MTPRQQIAALALLAEAVNSWPEYDRAEEILGADMIEWHADYRARILAFIRSLDAQRVEQQQALDL